MNCAERFFGWGHGAGGYEAILVTDKDSPVTVGRLRTEFEAVLSDARSIHRIVIYFAGHGMIRELESGLWFLSDWREEGVVVAYESLRQRLATFGINQVAIFSDACRSLPKSVFDLQLEERAVLALGHGQGEPDIDKFVAARDGKQAFVVPGSSESDDVCVFSGVLLEALSGTKPDAFSKFASDSITSSSLGSYLKAEVPRVAQICGLALKPTVVAAFPEGDNIYLTSRNRAVAIPPFQWPTPPGTLATEPPTSVIGPQSADLIADLEPRPRPPCEATPPRRRASESKQTKGGSHTQTSRTVLARTPPRSEATEWIHHGIRIRC